MRRAEVRDGQWRLLDREPIPSGDASWRQLIAFAWEQSDRRLLVAVNWGPGRAQGRICPPFGGLDGATWLLADLLDPTNRRERDGAELARQGLTLDLPGWRPTVLALTPVKR